ncbi:MAG: thymidine phosphorylase [Deltaproteobacteria bacterium]|nr:thymidine phosphorylase [Deltaproteobacteria bacterium]
MSFSITEIIKKKRNGGVLLQEEIQFFIQGVLDESIAAYQASALLMTIYFQGMNDEETYHLFEAMLNSGKKFDLSDISGKKVDKHSTGGVGDKTSLIVAPLVAACGVNVPMLSGRGLGHTGGTLDKLESIPGFNVQLGVERFKKVLRANQSAMMGQTQDIAPADRKLYALRDVTGTVECLSLIASSIMSKKMVEDLDGLVLDVKFGNGAFMKTLEKAKELAEVLVMLGERKGVRTRALLTNMNQPLGHCIGNALEIQESVEVLKGEGPEDLRHLSLQLSAHMLVLGERASSLNEAQELAENALNNGEAFGRFRSLVALQEGDVKYVENPQLLFEGVAMHEIHFETSGYLSSIDTEALGLAGVQLGAGRLKVEDKVDPQVGIIFHKKLGNSCKKGDKLATIYFRKEKNLVEVINKVQGAVQLSEQAPEQYSLIKEIIGI